MGVVSAIDIEPQQQKELLALLKCFLPNTTAWAYGSRVTWNNRHSSDLDVVVFAAVEQKKKVGYLREALEESNLPFRVDLFVWDSIPDQFKPNIEAAYYVLQEKTEVLSLSSGKVLGDFVELNPKMKLVKGTAYPFAEMKDLEPSSRSAYPSIEKNFSGSGSKFQSGDTLLARITPCLENGKTSQYRGTSSRFAWGSTEFIVLRGKEGVSDSDFVYYFSRSPVFRAYAIQSMVGSSGRQRVPNSAVANFECDLPPLAEQKAIAHVLGTLDDKIENNQKLNQALEEIAKAIFKSWFVDFDPVRAKAEGRPTGLPPEISDLFPDKLVKSEIGDIPKGWEVIVAGELFDITIGRTPPRKESHWFSEGSEGIPWISIKDMGSSGTYISTTNECLTEEAVKKHRMRVLPISTIIVSFKLTVGRVSILLQEMSTNEAIAHFPPSDKLRSQYFTYFFLNFFNYESLGSTSSIATAVNSKMIKQIPFIVPETELLILFEKMVSPIMNRVVSATRENFALTELRDTLLPKLISGELRIPDAEKLLEGCS